MVSADLPIPDAPADLAVVREFVNTTDRETDTDDLTTPADLTDYLRRAGLLTGGSRATRDDLALARELRSGLRKALELNHDGGSRTIHVLDETLARLPLALRWNGDGPRLVPTGTGVRGALAEIALAMHRAAAAGIWWRLKICSSDECEWAYYDASKNRSRNWCEYGCGNRIKSRNYRTRRRESAPA